MHALRGLLLWCAAVLAVAFAPVAADETVSYEILSKVREGDSVVAVVRQQRIMFLLYDQTIIGAEFDDEWLRKQAAFPGFAIMQASAYLDRKIAKAAQIGLGLGTVPTFLRDHGIPTDVVEISDAVVRQAANYFLYERCEEDDPEDCDNGETFVMDGLAFLNDRTPPRDDKNQEQRYDLFIVDVYTGWNPVLFLVQEVMETIKAKWLVPSRGVLVMNFVGYHNGPGAAVPRSIRQTLKTVFSHVKVFREVEDAADEEACNLVFYASDEPFSFNTPTGTYYENPDPNTYFNVSCQPGPSLSSSTKTEFRLCLEVFNDDDGKSDNAGDSDGPKPQLLTQADHGESVFASIHVATQAHMRERVVERFPESIWTDLGVKPKKSPSADDTKDEL
ncbi:TPA: hypothetical protein N0F65_002728 [Lagenidium giganteum]|uniref:Spermidine synthase n=1 Tax=Lagenidium giganteum TaxID=4803 RepID=A0AAV2Z757_9STRA|nr:TPA: hypothetical protein N0F65_002728 [Lagenidium giganteum]